MLSAYGGLTMDYFKVPSWIDRRIEETRHIYIGKLYPWWRRLPARKLFSNYQVLTIR